MSIAILNTDGMAFPLLAHQPAPMKFVPFARRALIGEGTSLAALEVDAAIPQIEAEQVRRSDPWAGWVMDRAEVALWIQDLQAATGDSEMQVELESAVPRGTQVIVVEPPGLVISESAAGQRRTWMRQKFHRMGCTVLDRRGFAGDPAPLLGLGTLMELLLEAPMGPFHRTLRQMTEASLKVSWGLARNQPTFTRAAEHLVQHLRWAKMPRQVALLLRSDPGAPTFADHAAALARLEMAWPEARIQLFPMEAPGWKGCDLLAVGY